jgi:hypothetical protein
VKYHLSLRALCTKRNPPLLICSITSNEILSSPSFNEKTMVGFEGGGGMVLTPKYTFLLTVASWRRWWGPNDLFISWHVLGSVDVMLRFIHGVGLLKIAVLVSVHACTQQIILVFVCGMYPL